ncbi:unnamed protein product [Fusarium langsethiae]|nr:unnamed protein product [Fusarium langsethiae]
MDQRQLFSPRDDLIDQAKPQIWGRQIHDAPECIILMARCKLLMSRQSLVTLELNVQGVESTSLGVNIRQCTQMGQDALRSTAEQMGQVRRLARDISKDEGIIDSIQKNIMNKTQSEFRHRRLQQFIEDGIDNVAKSVSVIADVKQNFDRWSKMTKDLLLALQQKTTDNMRKKSDIEEMNNPNIDPFISGAVALFKNPGVISAAFSFGLPGQMEGLQTLIRSLDDRLDKLHQEIGSTIDVRDILAKNLQDLSELQVQVENFMDFMISIQSIMDDIQRSHSRYLMKGLTPNNLDDLERDQELARDYTKDGALMKSRFLTAYKAASLYNEVSTKFILPGVSWLTGLCFDDTEAAFKEGLLEIEGKQGELCGGAKRLVTQRIKEIKIEMKIDQSTTPAKEMTADVEELSGDDEALQN